METFNGDTASIALSSKLTQKLHGLSRSHGATLFMTLLASFQALISRYSERFTTELERLDAGGLTAPDKLTAYAALYANVLREDRMCLCGMLAAEYETLPAPMRDSILQFFDHNEEWLQAVLEDGRSDNSMRFDGTSVDGAQMILGGLEGAMLVARPYHDVRRFEAAATRLIAGLTAAR